MDFLMVFMASGIVRGRVRTTTTTSAAELPNMAAILQLIGWQRNVPSVCSGRMTFFGGIFKEKKTHFYLLCRQTIVEVDLMFLRYGCTEAKKQKARINRQRGSEEDRDKERASSGERGETVLNNAMNYSESRARERRWNNTEQFRERKLTRAIERRRKYLTNWLRRLENFPSMFKNSRATWCCTAVQESHMIWIVLCRTWWSAVLLLLCARMPCAPVVEYEPPCLIKRCCVVPVWFINSARHNRLATRI